MTNIQTVALSSLQPPTANPRKSVNGVAGLAASIKEDGILQNLVVTPTSSKGKRQRYRIISGQRRYRALKLLQKQGDIKASYPVPVAIHADISEHDALNIATVENVQRAAMPPMDEAEAFAALVQTGASMEEVVARTGVSETTVRRRLALANLCEEAREALRSGEMSVTQAESLTLGTLTQQ